MSFKPDAIAGLVEESALFALHDLITSGVIRIAGEGWVAAIEIADHERLRPYRRMLMSLPPSLAELIYQAGTNWAALAFTAEKNWDKDLELVVRRRMSAIPKRRQGPAAAVR
jgi:hypothetical protein